MGSRADRTLKDIEELRSGLESKLGELERRFPMAGFGRRAAAVLAGGSAGGTALAFAFRRLRGRGRKKAAAQTVPSSVVVNVFPKGAAWIAGLGVAVWGMSRLYEAYNRSKAATDSSTSLGRPAVVKPMPEGRQSGAGS